MLSKTYQWFLLVVICGLAACYPKGAEYADDLNLVYTNYNKDFDFKSAHTYAVPDSVIKITGNVFTDPDGNGKPEFVDPVYAATIVATIKQNMATNGWTLVNKSSSPDVVILPSATSTLNLYYYYDWWYWGWYYPGFYPGWGWYYPGYPAYVSGYRSGSVFLQLIDNRGTHTPSENVPVEWVGVLNGLAEGNTSSITARIQTGINQAFAQSPYLKIN